MDLERFVADCEREGAEITFDDLFKNYHFGDLTQAQEWMRQKYYRMLTAAVKVSGARRVIELGCFFGGGAVALARGGAKVTTLDVRDQVRDRRLLTDHGIEQVILSDPQEVARQRWGDHDLVFVDIGDHQGELERQVHQSLAESFRGLALWDDTNYSPGMRQVWSSIHQPRLDTDWHAPWGFGIVKYGSSVHSGGYTVQTNHPVALDSLDHLRPLGTANDSYRNPRFNQKLFALYPGRQLRVTDWGCAGGGFVRDLVDAGHDAVGLEGSNFSLLRRRAEWATIPDRLFTCDISRPFTIQQAGQPVRFDVITAWEVMEHIPTQRLPILCENVRHHLAPGGLWILSVSHSTEDHHVTNRPRPWWEEQFQRERFTHHPWLNEYFGQDWVRGPQQDAPQSTHFCLTRQGEEPAVSIPNQPRKT